MQKILVVEDDREMNQGISYVLEEEGYRTISAHTIAEGRDAYEKNGADLILRRRGEKIVVQAKRYEKNVGIAAVQEAVGSVAYYDADRAMVVTNSGFTKSARNLARQNEVELWGR